MAKLRRANQLWSADSIHLRKVLYIPLEDTSHPQQLALAASAEPISRTNSLSSSEESSRNSAAFDENQNLTHPDLTSQDTLTNRAHTIRRIPVSQLSFFPPSTSKPKKVSDDSLRPGPNPTMPFAIQSQAQHGRYATSSSPSLNSILTALPIAASTRDTIIARLSFDSASSGSSDREREEEEHTERHELEDVHALRGRRASEDDIAYTYAQKTPTIRHPTPGYTGGSRPSPPPSPTGHRESSQSKHSMAMDNIKRASRDYQYVSQPRENLPRGSLPAAIRTVQLEPSPVMKLPLRKRRSRVESSGEGNGEGKMLVDITVASSEDETAAMI